ncbi:MAG: response regulator [Gammaproteobacteria bacterium]
MKVEKALVVDDSKVAHLTLRKLLTERNIAVDWVGSGEDSIVYLKKQRPDVVFMDIMMPGMDGFETIQAIGKDSTLHLPPVIMCSANATDEEKRNAKNSGAIDFLTKPYTSEELDTVLDRLRRASAAAPSASSRASDHHAAPSAPTRSTETRAPAAGGTSSENVIHLAEQAAFSTADKVAREVAAEVAHDRRGNRARDQRIVRAQSHPSRRQGGAVVTERIAQATAKDTAQGVAEEIARAK